MAYELTRADLEERLHDQLSFLSASGEAFDGGATPEAVRLAASVRVLVHDTHNSLSLLSQLGLKEEVEFLNTAPGIEGLVTPALTTVEVWTNGKLHFRPRLSDLSFEPTRVPFDEWWDMAVIADQDGIPFSRKSLILALANKEGGAHVDPELEPEYAALSRSGSLGWVIVDRGGSRPLLENPVPGSVRQIAYEVEQTVLAALYRLN